MNELVTLLDTALQANLSKRQWAAFIAVLRQTVGFRKTEDDLSARRLQQLTGIQRNHIWQAKNELVAMGLLCRQPGQFGDRLSFPETGHGRPETGIKPAQIRPDVRPKRDTTVSNLTVSKPDNGQGDASTVTSDPPEEPPAALDYPPELLPAEREQAAQQLDGLSPQAAQQVLAVWGHKIRSGEVRKSRLGLLIALVKASRAGQLNTDCLPRRHPATPPPDEPGVERQKQQREHWLEQQAHRGWLRDMARLSGLRPEQLATMRPKHAGGEPWRN